MSNKRLYIIDATAFCYRAYYALKGLSTSFGQPTNAIYGFITMLHKIMRENKPDYLAACFDVSRDTFRQQKFSQYKIQRPPMPEGLSSQIPIIKQIVSAYGIKIFQKAGFEADDLIATISKKAKKEGASIIVISSDKDILQLVDEDIVVFSPYKDTGTTYDQKKVTERFGVEPKKITDIIALMGDGVDNIPGVEGIGEKTAVKLISDFGSIKELLGNIRKIKQEKTKKLIADNIDQIKLSRDLAVLREDVDIDFDLEELRTDQPEVEKLFGLFKHLEFKKLLKDLPLSIHPPKIFQSIKITDKELSSIVDRGAELLIRGEALDSLIFCVKGKIFKISRPGKILRSILENSKIKKIGHDLKKLKVSLAKDNLGLNGLYFDIMIAAYLINPSNRGYDLSDLSFDYLGEPLSDKIDEEAALNLIERLRPRLENELEEKSLHSLFRDLEMPLVEVLAEMELNGINLDLAKLKGIAKNLEKKLIKLIEEIYDLSGCQFNINSPKQLRVILFEKLKLPVIKRSKTGPSTDEEVLRNLEKLHRLPGLLLEYRQLMKLKTTYIDTLPELVDTATGKLHTSFNQAGTETGRLSSSNPNLQNIPVKTELGRSIRGAIIASGDKDFLLSCDYSQIELRILAHLSGDKTLIEAFRNDRDIHRATAKLIYGCEESEVSDDMREVAKRVNFGIIYGLTSYGLSRDLRIGIEEAQTFIDTYFARYPKVKDYIREQVSKAQKDGFVSTMLGRRRYIPEINDKNQTIREFAKRKAINTPVQGSASDLIKSAMIQIHQQIKSRDLRAAMVLQVHDELVFDLPVKELKEVKDLVKDRMENVFKLAVPIKVDMKKGKNWLDLERIE
ncbi:MAG: DNA polymerase I [Candidatus Omnitrophota bacterium]